MITTALPPEDSEDPGGVGEGDGVGPNGGVVVGMMPPVVVVKNRETPAAALPIPSSIHPDGTVRV
jgi:hypothetical protein